MTKSPTRPTLAAANKKMNALANRVFVLAKEMNKLAKDANLAIVKDGVPMSDAFADLFRSIAARVELSPRARTFPKMKFVRDAVLPDGAPDPESPWYNGAKNEETAEEREESDKYNADSDDLDDWIAGYLLASRNTRRHFVLADPNDLADEFEEAYPDNDLPIDFIVDRIAEAQENPNR